MASLTVGLVVSGPGVNRSLFMIVILDVARALDVVSKIVLFVSIAEKSQRRRTPRLSRRIGRCREYGLPSDPGRIDHDVFDRVRRDLAWIGPQHHKVGEFARR